MSTSSRRVAWILWSTWLVCMTGIFVGLMYTAATSDGFWRFVFIGGAAVVGIEIRNFLRLMKPWHLS